MEVKEAIDSLYRNLLSYQIEPCEIVLDHLKHLEAIVDCCDAECLPDNSMTVNERVAVMAEKLREATAIVDKLPKTADGVHLYPGMTYYTRSVITDAIVKEQCRFGDSRFGPIDPQLCYSTPEAARLAAAEAGR